MSGLANQQGRSPAGRGIHPRECLHMSPKRAPGGPLWEDSSDAYMTASYSWCCTGWRCRRQERLQFNSISSRVPGCRRRTLLLVRTERNAGGAFLLLFAVAASEASQQPGSEGAGVKKAHGQGGPPAGNCKGECVALGGGHTTPVTCARWGPVWRHAQRLLLVPRCPPGLVLGGIWCGSHVFPCTCTWYRYLVPALVSRDILLQKK